MFLKLKTLPTLYQYFIWIDYR